MRLSPPSKRIRSAAHKRRDLIKAACIALGIVLGGAVLNAGADTGAANRIEQFLHACTQPQGERLDCDYRLLSPEAVTGFTAAIESVPLPNPRTTDYPYDGSSSAILFLIDAGTFNNLTVIETIVEHIRLLIGLSKPHHRVGVATFHGNPTLTLPIGSVPKDIVAAVRTLTSPHSSESTQHDAYKALRILGQYPAVRKALFFFTDGAASSESYYQSELVAAARDANVSVYSVAYVSSEQPSSALNALKRLSKETNGALIRADPRDFSLPDEFMKQPYAAIDSGGQLSIDLSAAVTAGLSGPRWVTLKIALQSKTIEVPLPVTVPEPVPAVSATGQAPPPSAAMPVAQLGSPSPDNLWVYLLTGIGLVTLIGGYMYFRQDRTPRADEPDTINVPRAYLVRKNDADTRHVITASPWRIGRGKDNEVVVPDSSVSRHHAEIIRNPDGTFAIKDLDSLNGLFVSDKKVRRSMLSSGCEIDIGDVRFTFAIEGADVNPADTVVSEPQTVNRAMHA
ncbi:MAG: FHA domain-containing protein [Gammaproteobacteria bacterium]